MSLLLSGLKNLNGLRQSVSSNGLSYRNLSGCFWQHLWWKERFSKLLKQEKNIY